MWFLVGAEVDFCKTFPYPSACSKNKSYWSPNKVKMIDWWQRRLDLVRGDSIPYLKLLALAMALSGVVGAFGCSTKTSDQLRSLAGARTEELRDEVRNEPHRDKLIVFVHGFNSSKEAAWGQFPALLEDDDDFREFNIHRFGYPTKLCRQVDDIRNQGEFLASYLTSIFKSTQPKYRQVVLVGHSMGGLVILHALLKLERDHLQLLRNQDLRILTFGTPYLGVENTDVLLLFCENKQVNDMSVLKDSLGELGREWTQRFNQQPGSGRNTPQVRLHAFRGTEDQFITKTSACGYPQIPCEPVDGDHNSIVKPLTRAHLAYQKLKLVSLEIYSKTPSEPSSNLIELSLVTECHPALMPKLVPSSGRIYVLSPWPMEPGNGGGGLGEYYAEAGSEFKWRSHKGIPSQAYHCQITNYGKVPVFKIMMNFPVIFREVIRDRENPNATKSGEITISRDWPIEVTKIDPGINGFSFYIYNQSQQFVQVSLPESATLSLLHDKIRRNVRMTQASTGGYQMYLMPFPQGN